MASKVILSDNGFLAAKVDPQEYIIMHKSEVRMAFHNVKIQSILAWLLDKIGTLCLGWGFKEFLEKDYSINFPLIIGVVLFLCSGYYSFAKNREIKKIFQEKLDSK